MMEGRIIEMDRQREEGGKERLQKYGGGWSDGDGWRGQNRQRGQRGLGGEPSAQNQPGSDGEGRRRRSQALGGIWVVLPGLIKLRPGVHSASAARLSRLISHFLRLFQSTTISLHPLPPGEAPAGGDVSFSATTTTTTTTSQQPPPPEGGARRLTRILSSVLPLRRSCLTARTNLMGCLSRTFLMLSEKKSRAERM